MTDSVNPRPLRARHWNILLHEPQVPGQPWIVSLVMNRWVQPHQSIPDLMSREYVPESQIGAHVERLLYGVQPRFVERTDPPF